MLGSSDTPWNKILPLKKNLKVNHIVYEKKKRSHITFIAIFCYNWLTYYCLL